MQQLKEAVKFMKPKVGSTETEAVNGCHVSVTCPNAAVVIFGLAPTGRILEVANFTLSSEEMNVQEAAPRAKNKRDT